MNLEKIFDFIKEKRGYDYPVKYKLINGIPLSEDDLNVEGTLDLYGSNIKSLPDNLHVGRNLYLNNTNIESLPDNLHVGGSLDLSNTKTITSLPDNLKVGGDLYLEYSSLFEKYKREIRKMIKDKGGFVKGYIYR